MVRRTTYRVAAGLGSALALMLTPGVAAAAGWTSVAPVNQSTDVAPSVAMDGVGNTILAWENSSTSPTSIPGAHHTIGVPFFQALPDFSAAIPGTPHDSITPLVVLNRAGNGFVAWVHTTNIPTDQEIEVSTIKSDGTVAAPVAITAGGNDTGLSAAINENGDAVIAWLKGGNTVQVSTRQGLSGTFSAEFDVANMSATGPPSAAIDSAGNAIAVWPHNNGVHIEINGKRHASGAPNASWTSEAAIASGGVDLTEPVVAANPTGQLVVAFLQGGSSVGAVSGTVSGGWGATPTISTLSGTLVSPHGPAVTMLDKGGAAVGWSTTNAVQMSLRPPPPATFAQATVKSVTTVTPESFTLGSDGQGEIIAAWYSFNNTSMTNVVSVSVKQQASPTFGAPQIISDPAVFSNPPVLSFDQSGDAVAAFTTGMSPTTGLSAAFYDNTPPHAGPVTALSTATTGTAVSFSIPQPTDSFSTVPSIVWNFGDGSATATGTSVSHTFTSPGTFLVNVVATDAAGNATSASTQITVTKSSPPPPPPPKKVCRVPKLKGKTLGQATPLLVHANCKLGRVTKPKKPRHRKLRKLVVSRSNPGAGTVRPAGTKVALTLVEVPKPKPKHKKHK